nr:hypothetical protein CFP56_50898 [Quercus suber]
MIFINRWAGSSQTSGQRILLSQAYRDRSDEIVHTKKFCQATFSHVENLRTLLAQHQLRSSLMRNPAVHSTTDAPLFQTYRALLHEFEPRNGPIGIFSADRINASGSKHYSTVALCIRSLLPLASLGIEILDISLFSLLCMYYGRLHADVGLVELSLSLYTDTLQQFHGRLRNVISNTNIGLVPRQDLMCASLALVFFEIIAEIDVYGPGHVAHFDAAMNFLQHCGPSNSQSSPVSQLLSRILTDISINIDIHRRVPSFLREPEWLTVTSDAQASSMKAQLFRIGSGIPYLLMSADILHLDLHSARLTQERFAVDALALLEEFAAVKSKFDAWHHDLHKSGQEPLYWSRSQPIVQPVDLKDDECTPKYKNSFHQLSFRSGPDAGLLVQSWAFQLELTMTSTDLQEALLKEDILMSERPQIKAAISKARVAAGQMAQLILEAEPYLSSCFEGLICLQSPLKVTKRFFARHLFV